MSAARSSRFLLQHQQHEQHNSSPQPQPPPSPAESDVVVILATLLCAVVCVVGLALVARCAWLRRSLSGRSSSTSPQLPTASVAITPPPNKGVKKKVLRSLPKLSYDQAFPPPGLPSSVPPTAKLSSECPICLAEFVAGDEIRVLPHCGHGFHVACVDTWLRTHSSCPSCRQILIVSAPHADRRCRKCGASASAGASASSGEPNGNGPSSSSTSAAAAAAAGESRAKGREDRDAGRFLP